jgi:5-methylcytosine-specific restriction endonuclease McrA
MAKVEILNEPQCVECARHGIVTTENLQRDHVNGFNDEHGFWFGERQTLCRWHNTQKAGKEGNKAKNAKK